MAEWNKQNMVQWILGALLTASLTIGGLVWNNYHGKTLAYQAKLEMKAAQIADLQLQKIKLEVELSQMEKDNAEFRDEIKSLERKIRRLER